MVFRFKVLQMRTRSPLLGLQICVFFVFVFVMFFCIKVPSTCLRTANALAILRLCEGLLEALLVACLINFRFSCADIFG